FSRTQRRLSSSSAIRIRAGIVSTTRRPDRTAGGPFWGHGAPSPGDREETGHGGAPAFGALAVDDALVLLHDAVAQSQAKTEATLLGREERIEDLGPHIGRDAGALVGYLGLHHRALPGTHVHLAVKRVHAHPRHQRQATALLHRVDRVGHQ